MIAQALAFEEQHRGEGLASRAAEIATTPGHPSTDSLWLYRHCARVAFESAAALSEQPDGSWRA